MIGFEVNSLTPSLKSAPITMVSGVASAKSETPAALSSRVTTRLPALAPELTTLAATLLLSIASRVVGEPLMVKVTLVMSKVRTSRDVSNFSVPATNSSVLEAAL